MGVTLLNATLVRDTFTDTATIGKLYIDNKYVCDTLEDVDRHLENGGQKVYGETAIPLGSYEVQLTYSNRFKQIMPLLINVPQFVGIRIHTGNTPKNTLGCILVGSRRGNTVFDSRVAYRKLYPMLEAAIAKDEQVTLKIERASC